MVLTVTIDGTPVTVKESSLKIGHRIDDKDAAQFTVIDTTGTHAWTQNQPVEISDDVLGTLFTGFLNNPTMVNLFPSAVNEWDMQCVNHIYSPAKKVHTRRHKGQQAAPIAALQIQKYLEPDGVSGSFGLDWSELQTDWQQGSLSGTTSATNASTGNVGAGDLELAPGGVTYHQSPTAGSVSTVAAIGITGYASSISASPICVRQIWSGSQVMTGAPSSFFQFDVWISSTSPSIVATVDLAFSDGTTYSQDYPTVTDAQGMPSAWTTDLSGLATDTWYTRQFACSVTTKTIVGVNIVLAGNKSGTYNAYFKNIYYYNGTTNTYFFNASLVANKQLSLSGYSNVALSQIVAASASKQQTIISAGSYSGPVLVQTSQVSWDAIVPDACSLLVESTMDGEASWQTVTNGGPIGNILPGMQLSTINLVFRATLDIGPDPTQITLGYSNFAVTIIPAYSAIKTDMRQTYGQGFSATAFNAAGTTLSNTILNGNNQLTLSGYQTVYGNPVDPFYTGAGSFGSVTTVANQMQFLLGTSEEQRIKIVEAGQWQNFIAECDITLSAASIQGGLVYRTTGWQNTLDTYAYVATFSTTQLQLGRGTNTSGGAGAFTSIATASLNLSAGSTHRLKLVVSGNTHQVYIDSVLLISATDSTWPSAGYFGFRGLSATSGNTIVDFSNFGVVSALTGTWQSASFSIASVGTYGNSLVQWDTDNLPDDTATISVQTSIDGGSTFQSISNGGAISGLTAGQSLTGINLLLLVTLTATTAPTVPVMNGISAWVMTQYSSTGTRSTAPLLWDTMIRSNVVGGFGTATNGATYTKNGTGTVNLTSDEALISNTTGSLYMIASGVSATDEDGLVRFELSSSSMQAGMTLRNDGSVNNYYRFITTGTTMTLTKKMFGVAQTLQTGSISLSINTWYWMRFRATGAAPVTLQGKIWADGTTEPDTWNMTYAD